MESFKKKVKNFSKKDLAGKEKALYICSRLQRKQVPKNTEKKSRVGNKIRGSSPLVSTRISWVIPVKFIDLLN